jgi:GNAT superfamily N-acetyltransferase
MASPSWIAANVHERNASLMVPVSNVPVERVEPGDSLWPELFAHLDRVEQRRHAFAEDGTLRPDSHFLAVVLDDHVVGNIGLNMQELVVPATSTSAGYDLTLRDPGGAPLRELYVQSFAVEPEHRRRGYGRALQLAALDLARELGCYQMRSWSSVDRPENYALKLSLGFAAHPATHRSATTGLEYSGVYFIRKLR